VLDLGAAGKNYPWLAEEPGLVPAAGAPLAGSYRPAGDPVGTDGAQELFDEPVDIAWRYKVAVVAAQRGTKSPGLAAAAVCRRAAADQWQRAAASLGSTMPKRATSRSGRGDGGDHARAKGLEWIGCI